MKALAQFTRKELAQLYVDSPEQIKIRVIEKVISIRGQVLFENSNGNKNTKYFLYGSDAILLQDIVEKLKEVFPDSDVLIETRRTDIVTVLITVDWGISDETPVNEV
jgi:hypothetical protein